MFIRWQWDGLDLQPARWPADVTWVITHVDLWHVLAIGA